MILFDRIKGMDKDELAKYIVNTIVIAIGEEQFTEEVVTAMFESARVALDEEVKEDDAAHIGLEKDSKVVDVPEDHWTSETK